MTRCVLPITFLVLITLTNQEVAKYTPKNLCIRLSTNTTAVIQWVEPSILRSEIMGYKVYYTRNPENPLRDWNTLTIGSYPLVTIRDMETGELYSFKISVRTLGLEEPEPISDVYNFKMLNRTRSCYDQPANLQKSLDFLRATATSSTSLEVWWNLKYDPAEVTGFQVVYRLDNGTNWQSKTVGLTNSAALTNLQESDNYTIGIAAITLHEGLSYYPQEITIMIDPVDVPTNLQVQEFGAHSLTLTWLPPTRVNPFKYRISYDAVKDFIDSQGKRQHFHNGRMEQIVSGHYQSQVLTSLTPFTNYNINISVIPIDQTYLPPSTILAQTAMAAPNPMTKPDLYGIINEGNIQLLLPQASEEFGHIHCYYVVVVPEREGDAYVSSKSYSTEALLANEWEEGRENDAPYIGARFSARIPYAFILGAGDHGGFKNRKLDPRKRYRVFVRAVVATPQADLFTDSPFSDYISIPDVKTTRNIEQPLNSIA